jgi:hypothetical protein
VKKTDHNRYVLLDRDVRASFPDDESVNEALRVILTAAQALARHLSIRSKEKKRREQNYEEKLNCRVLAMSGKRVLYATPIRQSRRDLRKRIVSNQQRLLQNEHPEFKNMTNVQYVLQWRKGGRWVNDKV